MNAELQPAPELVAEEQRYWDAARFAAAACAIILGSIIFSFRFTSFLHAKELVIYLCIIALSIACVIKGRLDARGFAALLPIWLFIAACAVNLALGSVYVRVSAVSELLRWLTTAGYGLLIYDLAAKQKWRRGIHLALEISVMGVALLGMIQYFGLMPGLFPVFPQYTQRVYSVFGNQDLYGGYVAMGIPLILARETDSGRWSRWPLAFALIFALLLSGSRSSWLAGAAGFVMWLHSERRPGRYKSIAVIAAVTAICLGIFAAPQATMGRFTHTFTSSDEGYVSRLACWRAGWTLFTRAPLFGAGLGNFAYWSPSLMGRYCETHGTPAALDLERHADHPHSEPVRLLAESGLTGFLCACWIMWLILRRKGVERAPLVSLAVFAMFNGLFLSVPHLLSAMTLWVLLTSQGGETRHLGAVPSRITPLFIALAAAVLIWSTAPQSILLQKALDAQADKRPSFSLYKSAASQTWASADAHKEYGLALMSAGQDAVARTELAAALKGLDTGDIYLALATVSARQKDFESARQFARQCAKRWPGNEDVRKLLSSLEKAATTPDAASTRH
jgi:O-antigen ligase